MHCAKTLMKYSKQNNNNNNNTLRIEVCLRSPGVHGEYSVMVKAGWDLAKNAGTRWQAPMCHPKFCHCKYHKQNISLEHRTKIKIIVGFNLVH